MRFPRLKYTPVKNIDGNPVSAAPVVYALTPPNGPWSGSNNIGQVVDFAPNANNTQTILKLDEWGPPDVWTLSLGLSYNGFPPGTAAPNFNFIEIEANIEFGAGGSTQFMRCSWLNGTRLSLPMNAVSVYAKYGFDFLSYPSTTMVPPTGLRLSAMLARGYIQSNCVSLEQVESAAPATFTRYVEIPPFTRSFSAPALNGDSGTYAATTQLQTYTADAGDNIMVRAIPGASLVNDRVFQLLPAERYIRFFDSTAAGIRSSLLFNIGT